LETAKNREKPVDVILRNYGSARVRQIFNVDRITKYRDVRYSIVRRIEYCYSMAWKTQGKGSFILPFSFLTFRTIHTYRDISLGLFFLFFFSRRTNEDQPPSPYPLLHNNTQRSGQLRLRRLSKVRERPVVVRDKKWVDDRWPLS